MAHTGFRHPSDNSKLRVRQNQLRRGAQLFSRSPQRPESPLNWKLELRTGELCGGEDRRGSVASQPITCAGGLGQNIFDAELHLSHSTARPARAVQSARGESGQLLGQRERQTGRQQAGGRRAGRQAV